MPQGCAAAADTRLFRQPRTPPLIAPRSTADDPALFCAMLPARFFFQEHVHGGNRWALCAQEICYRTRLLGQFFQSGKTLPIRVGAGLRVGQYRLHWGVVGPARGGCAPAAGRALPL